MKQYAKCCTSYAAEQLAKQNLPGPHILVRGQSCSRETGEKEGQRRLMEIEPEAGGQHCCFATG